MRPTLAFAMLFGLCVPLAAEEPQPIELSIEARAIESPLLKYRLFPSEAERKPGNAVPILLRLPWEQTIYFSSDAYKNLADWEKKPLDSPEWQGFASLPGRFYNEMKRAAFRRDADWEYPIGEEPAYFVLLPDVQGLRQLAGHGLSARIRYHLSRGELDEAREAVLVGMAISRHMAETPFFVNQLVAAAIQRTMLERTAELIEQPNSPNLYWALSTLPDLQQLERAASLEASAFAMTFPAAGELDRPRSTDEWRKMAEQLVEVLEGESPPAKPEDPNAPWLDKVLSRVTAPSAIQRTPFVKLARAELADLLRVSAEEVAAMSDEEAGIRWYVHVQLHHDQRAAAILSLPPREAWPRLVELEADMAAYREKAGSKEKGDLDSVPTFVAIWGVQRRIDALRIIEAVRHHLASHDGKLPRTLDEIRGVSIPLDPLTDQPFEWLVEGNTATLRAPALPAEVVKPGTEAFKSSGLEYRLNTR